MERVLHLRATSDRERSGLVSFIERTGARRKSSIINSHNDAPAPSKCDFANRAVEANEGLRRFLTLSAEQKASSCEPITWNASSRGSNIRLEQNNDVDGSSCTWSCPKTREIISLLLNNLENRLQNPTPLLWMMGGKTGVGIDAAETGRPLDETKSNALCYLLSASSYSLSRKQLSSDLYKLCITPDKDISPLYLRLLVSMMSIIDRRTLHISRDFSIKYTNSLAFHGKECGSLRGWQKPHSRYTSAYESPSSELPSYNSNKYEIEKSGRTQGTAAALNCFKISVHLDAHEGRSDGFALLVDRLELLPKYRKCFKRRLKNQNFKSTLAEILLTTALSLATERLNRLSHDLSDLDQPISVDDDTVALSLFGWSLLFFTSATYLFKLQQNLDNRHHTQFLVSGLAVGLLYARVQEATTTQVCMEILPLWTTMALTLSWIVDWLMEVCRTSQYEESLHSTQNFGSPEQKESIRKDLSEV